MKIVGKQSRIPATPEEAVLRAGKIIAEAFRVSPIKKPRGFVVKFKTREEHEAWHQAQKTNSANKMKTPVPVSSVSSVVNPCRRP